MADLPADCLSTDPPFTNVGLDVFGTWAMMARRTRGCHAQSKRWAVIFTCLSMRAAHIELIDSTSVNRFFLDQGCIWQFNPPHAPHMGGYRERMVGLAMRILDAMFQQLGSSALTHDMLSTLMAEVTAVINARPLVPV